MSSLMRNLLCPRLELATSMCYLRMRYHYKNSVKRLHWLKVGRLEMKSWQVETEKVGRLGVPPSIQKFIATLAEASKLFGWYPVATRDLTLSTSYPTSCE